MSEQGNVETNISGCVAADRDARPGIRRRQMLGTALALGAGSLAARAASSPAEGESWDITTDVLCVGSGAAALSAAVTARANGADVVVIEKLPMIGGTTGKSGGVAWIANNRFLRADGISDDKADALRYMVRFSYPQRFTPEHPTLGVSEAEYKLIEAFYDHGAEAIEALEATGAISFKPFKMFFVNKDAPDYADHLPENKVPAGRAIEPAVGSGGSEGGGSLAYQLEDWLIAQQVRILTDTAAAELVIADQRVQGVTARRSDGSTLRIRARRGVVFGTGGFGQNVDLLHRYQVAVYGSCSSSGAQGDFIRIASQAGATMGNLSTAWRSQVVLEEALADRRLGRCADYLPGDSMVVLNKYGKRCVNEKRDYNDRTTAHLYYDPTGEDYPNQLMFMLFDERSRDSFAGSYPFTLDKREMPGLIEAPTMPALFDAIEARLKTIETRTGGVRLDAGFRATASAELKRFNQYARDGVDPDFKRGVHNYDREWHLLFSARREGTNFAPNPFPNNTMHPLAEEGPFYCMILAAGALDTNGGPMINHSAQVLDHALQPIPGLYGAGNCIASPSREAYYGAGCTIGLALTYGYIAARHALQSTAG